MSWQVGATALMAVTLISSFPSEGAAQDGLSPGRRLAEKESRVPVATSTQQVSREFISRLFPIKGKLYDDRRWLTTRLANPGFPQDTRSIEQFEDKESAQLTCWQNCSIFLNTKDIDRVGDLRKCGVAFVYLPPDDFDRQHWGESAANPDGPGRHIVSFKRNDVYVTVVIQKDAIAFTFEYQVDHKDTKPSVEETQKKIAAIYPLLEYLDLEKCTPEQDVAGYTTMGLGKAKAKGLYRFTEDWIRSIRWWSEPGRFGISSTIKPYDDQTGRIYYVPY